MKFFLLFFSALILTFTSCASDDAKSSPDENYILPKTIILKEIGSPVDQTLTTNTFSGNKIVSSITGNFKILYSYEGNLITKEETFILDPNAEVKERKTREILHTYENGKLKTSILMRLFTAANPNGQYASKIVYTHTSDNLISYVEYSVTTGTPEEKIVDRGILTFKDGNLVKYEQYFMDSPTLTGTFQYEYDTSNNPFKNVLGYRSLKVKTSAAGNNNVIRGSSTIENIVDQTIFRNTFTYNDKGYPILSIETKGYGTEIDSETRYTY
ncbi:hypothetical protein [Flavobacterium sp. FlaQc-50]|jgi:hypothetical protein|uniref:hypothetical protein n=1 Tax=unclassified Flavobacterium TaxID=196869 RepID=UPI00375719A7